MALQGALAQAVSSSKAKVAIPTVAKSSIADNIWSSIAGQAKSGFTQAKGAMDTILAGNSTPIEGLEAGLNVGSGVASVALSPLAPIINKVSEGIQQQFNMAPDDPRAGLLSKALNSLTNNPDFQKFAQSHAGQTTARVATDLGNAGNIAGTITGLGEGADLANKGITALNTSTPGEPSGISSEAQLQSRIQDATPAYNENMVGQNVMTADTVDAQGNPVKGKITPRIASEGGSSKLSTTARPVTTSASETAAGTEANNIPNYPDKGTALEKMLSTQDAISTEAENMRGSLQAEDKASPLDTTAEKTKVADIIKSNLPKEIQDKLGYISPADEAKLPPAAKAYREALISNQEETLPKTAAGRYYQQVLDAVKEYDGTREGKLDLRQTIDSAYKQARGKLAFGGDSGNAIDEVNSDIRKSLNKDLADTTKNSDTQASLKRQSNLYNHKEVLTEKAQAESNTNFGKLEQKYPSLKNLIRIAQRQGIMLPIRMLETGIGITIAGKWLHDQIYNN